MINDNINFKKYFNKENFENLLMNFLSSKELNESLYQYFKDNYLNGNIQLQKPGNHTINSIDCFNENIKQNINYKDIEEKYLIDEFFDSLNHTIFTEFSIIKIKNKEINNDDLYDKFINYINNLNINCKYSEKFTCIHCNEKMSLIINNGDMEYKKIRFKENQETNANFFDCIDISPKKIEVNFVSGNLLVADWFRINKFNSYFNKIMNISLDSTNGIIQRTQEMAKQNVVMIQVGNSSPNIYINEYNEIIFGDEEYKNENNNDIKKIGNVCTDLWATTIIDKQNLIEILSQELEISEAKKIIDNYIIENDITEIYIPPGKYYIYYSPLEKNAINNDLNMNNEACQKINIQFILSNNDSLLKNMKKRLNIL